MVLTDKQLQARDAMRDIGAEMLQSVREMKAGKGRMPETQPRAIIIAGPNGAGKTTFAREDHWGQRTIGSDTDFAPSCGHSGQGHSGSGSD